jgi:GH15 family glucan-1,4-alpha-glucosidase
LWQYGYEWSGDASMIAIALIYSGQFEVAQRVIENILTRLTNDAGMAMESSRFRGGPASELNNNGEILHACRTYYEWTGSKDYRYYPRIRAVADYLLDPQFLDPETGMLIAARDIWERSAATGVQPGYDVSHQSFAIRGLRDAVWIAELFGEAEDKTRWMSAHDKLRASFLQHGTHSFIENDRVIKRRLLDGSVQRALSTKIERLFAEMFVPEGMPLAEEGEHPWEPDISCCFPITLGILDPRSDAAKNTVAAMDALWSQAWEDGGYGRYNIHSEPDSPGPWPFATAIVAGAALEVGDFERAQRAIAWLIHYAGAGGNWFEFYGDRPTPPLPPTGIIAWGWAQWIILIVRHMLGARVKDGELKLHPRMAGFEGAIRFRDTMVPINQ